MKLSKKDIKRIMLTALQCDYFGNFTRVEEIDKDRYHIYCNDEDEICSGDGLIKNWDYLAQDERDELVSLYL